MLLIFVVTQEVGEQKIVNADRYTCSMVS